MGKQADCHPERKHRAHGLCTPCYMVRYYAANRDTMKTQSVINKYAVHGLTKRKYSGMLAASNGRCAICNGRNISNKRLCVDHDHSAGRLRGMLCDHCNHGLGKFRDNPALLRAGADYLERYRSN